MGDLGEALALMYVAGYQPLSSLRATLIDSWNESLRWRAYYDRAIETGPNYIVFDGGGSMSGGIPPRPTEVEPTSSDEWRLWVEPPSRIRIERGESIVTRDGDKWSIGVHAGEGDQPSGIGEEAALLLDPSVLLAAFRFSLLGRETIAGRDAIRLRAEVRKDSPHPFLSLLSAKRHAGLGPVGTMEYAVDAERGFLLREAEMFQGEAYWRREVVEIAYDEDLPAEIFAPPAGGQALPTAEIPQPTEVTLEEAARVAGFSIFRLDLPDEWRCDATFQPAYPPYVAEKVLLHYWLPDATQVIDVEETTAAADQGPDREVSEFRLRPGAPGSYSGRWERVGDDTVPDGEYTASGASITLHKEGAKIIIQSMGLTTEDIEQLADALSQVQV